MRVTQNQHLLGWPSAINFTGNVTVVIRGGICYVTIS